MKKNVKLTLIFFMILFMSAILSSSVSAFDNYTNLPIKNINGKEVVYGIDLKNNTVEEVITSENFNMSSYEIKAYKNDALLSKKDRISTNTLIKVYRDGNLVKQYYVLIYGDVTGNGISNSSDALAIIKNKLNKVKINDDIYLEAGRILEKTRTNKSIPSSSDALAIVHNKLGKYSIIQDYDKDENDYNRYYYNQLDNYAKEFYDFIISNKENIKSGVSSLEIPKNISDILYLDNGPEIYMKVMQSARDAIALDNPELFYLDFSKIILATEPIVDENEVTYILTFKNLEGEAYKIPKYGDDNGLDSVISRIERKREEIVKNATGSNFDKIKYIHDWLIDNVCYDITMSRENAHNIYGTLIEKEVVCEGYSKALKYLLDELNIPCVIVNGVATNSSGIPEAHSWNYVKLNGNWYAIDATWDDPITAPGVVVNKERKYLYFLKGSNLINKDHTEDGKMSENSTIFLYPTLSNEDY